MIDQTPSPDEANDSTAGPDPATDLEAERRLRKAAEKEAAETRREAAGYRVKLRELKQQGNLTVAAWRPSSDPRTDGLVGYADIRLGSLLVFDVRLIRREGVFGLSWPARRPMASERLHEIMRPTPALDGRALAALLEFAFPADTVELPA